MGRSAQQGFPIQPESSDWGPNGWEQLHRHDWKHTSLSNSRADSGAGCESWRCSAVRMRSSSSCFARFRWRFVSGRSSASCSPVARQQKTGQCILQHGQQYHADTQVLSSFLLMLMTQLTGAWRRQAPFLANITTADSRSVIIKGLSSAKLS